MLESGQIVLVLGHTGKAGAAIVRRLQQEDVTIEVNDPRVDLRDRDEVLNLVHVTRPDVIVLAAAVVGGIFSHTVGKWGYFMDNMQIEMSVLQSALDLGVPRLLYLGSSCIYPRNAPQPIPESAMLTSPLEPTNEGYAIAKIAGLKLVQFAREQFGLPWISCTPTNLYGPGDRYRPRNRINVMPAMIRRMVEARRCDAPGVTIMGTGTPLREFIHVDDFADAAVLLLREWDDPRWINIGSGREISTMGLARMVASAAGYEGSIEADGNAAMDGMPRKVLDTSLIRSLGWEPRVLLEEGIARCVNEYEARYPTSLDAD